MLYGLSIINGDYSNIEDLKNIFKIKSTIPDEQSLFSVEKDPSKLGDKWNEFPFGFSYLCGEKENGIKIGLIGMTFRLWKICAMVNCLIS